MTTAKTLFDWVCATPDIVPEMTKGGIIVPRNAKSMQPMQIRATVICTGTGYRSEKSGQHFPVPVKVGDRIVYPHNIGLYDKIDDMDVVYVKEGDIMAVLTETEAQPAELPAL